MNCPRHGVPLTNSEVPGREFDRCPECAGLWIPGASVDAVLGSGEVLKLRSLCSVRRSQLSCPQDGEVLGEGRIGPVTVDLCLQCNGLWLDHGELEQLLQRKPLTPHQRSAPEGSSDDRTSGGVGAEVLLYTLLGL